MRRRPEIILVVGTLLSLIGGGVWLVIHGHQAAVRHADRVERLRPALPSYLRLDTELIGFDFRGKEKKTTVQELLLDLGADAKGAVIFDPSGKTIIFFKMPDLHEVRLREDQLDAHWRREEAEGKKARDLEKTNTVIRLRRDPWDPGFRYWITP